MKAQPFNPGDMVRLVDAQPHRARKPPFPADTRLTVWKVSRSGRFVVIAGYADVKTAGGGGYWAAERFEAWS